MSVSNSSGDIPVLTSEPLYFKSNTLSGSSGHSSGSASKTDVFSRPLLDRPTAIPPSRSYQLGISTMHASPLLQRRNIQRSYSIRDLNLSKVGEVDVKPLKELKDAKVKFAHTTKDLSKIAGSLNEENVEDLYNKRMASQMLSLRQLFKIGTGPSSSHTMGPRFACQAFLKKFPDTKKAQVTLFGSLASTGKGHLTDVAILDELKNLQVELIWNPDEDLDNRVNGLRFKALDGQHSGDVYECFSVGGGRIVDRNESKEQNELQKIYPYSNLTMILKWTEVTGKSLYQYVTEYEGESIWEHLENVWKAMDSAVTRGLASSSTVLPGGLNTPRRAKQMYLKTKRLAENMKRSSLVSAYALAVSEENAGGGMVVTAPTCGACGVIPAVLRYMKDANGIEDQELLQGLAVAGLICNIIKANGSISGAECGCQAEIGSACSGAAAALTMLMGGTPHQIGRAAAMSMEHCLGLTCDPCEGLVQVPCIERNAFYANQAFVSAEIAILEDSRVKAHISFDEVVFTMLLTGKAMNEGYKETAKEGLAKTYKMDNEEDEYKFFKQVNEAERIRREEEEKKKEDERKKEKEIERENEQIEDK
ncbi:MAG: L-serine dehydratase [Streblomastix strix]|uniref:L-serine dehydratase n=1 Tax=Streblomastix strix TaxID=222440 RepID=A0A5J4WCL2_9EUKA|nr:MAG: L-serine dehydratase [Streblomastix strix]